jgi:hypothetical protein
MEVTLPLAIGKARVKLRLFFTSALNLVVLDYIPHAPFRDGHMPPHTN